MARSGRQAARAPARHAHHRRPVAGSVAQAAQAMACGLAGVLVKPVVSSRLLAAAGSAIGPPIRVRPGIRPASAMAGSSPAMQEVFCRIARAAVSEQPVLIVGPPGSGKSLAAWMIHSNSSQRSQAFRSFDMRVIPPAEAGRTVLGGEQLQGASPGGTLVIDGARLLSSTVLAGLRMLAGVRVVLVADADREGGIDPRWIGRVGALQVIAIPPLRARPEDLGPIARQVLQQQADRIGRDLELSMPAFAAMARHRWPGNVRELGDTLAEAAGLASGGVILPEHLPLEWGLAGAAGEDPLEVLASAVLDAGGEAMARWRERVDGVLLHSALERTGGNQVQAAALLGISRPTLRKRCALLANRPDRRLPPS